MKSIGIVRTLDQMGRIVLPMELRKVLDLLTGTPMEIYTEGESIILHKHQNKCEFCGSNDVVTKFKNKALCNDCLESMKAISFTRL